MKNKTRLICAFIDGLGYEYLDSRTNLEFLSGKDGTLSYRKPLETVFGSTAACLATILSGKLPQQHGHFMLLYSYPKSRLHTWLWPLHYIALLQKGARAGIRPDDMRGWQGGGYEVAQVYKFFSRYYKVLRLDLWSWDLDENSRVCKNDLVGTLKQSRTEYRFWGSRTPDSQKFLEVMEAIESGYGQFLFLYLSELDTVAQNRGLNSPEADAQLAYYDENLKRVFECARSHSSETYFILFSDHGMCDTKEIIDLEAELNKLQLVQGKEYFVFIDGSTARFWFRSPHAEEQIRNVLNGLQEKGQVLPPERLKELGVYFPDSKFGELIFATNPGIIMFPNLSGMKSKAMHCFLPSDPSMNAVFCSNFVPRPEPCHIKDIYGILTGLLPFLKPTSSSG